MNVGGGSVDEDDVVEDPRSVRRGCLCVCVSFSF